MKEFLKWVLAAFMLLSLTMVPGCGTRKANLNKTSSSSKSSENVTENHTSQSTLESTGKEQVVQSNDVSGENSTTVVEETFPNPLPGMPSKRTTTTTKGTTSDKTKISTSKDTKESGQVNVADEIKKVQEAQEEASSKSKQTVNDKSTATNLGGPWVVISVSAFVIFALFAYFYWKKK